MFHFHSRVAIIAYPLHVHFGVPPQQPCIKTRCSLTGNVQFIRNGNVETVETLCGMQHNRRCMLFYDDIQWGRAQIIFQE